MAPTGKQIPNFYKCFNAADRKEKLHLPESWSSHMGRSLPSEAILRNRYGDCWKVKIAHYQNTDKFWFEEGWTTFAEQNKLAYKDHIIFNYDGKSTFTFKLFDETDDEKEYVRILNSEEEKDEHLDDMQLEQVLPEFQSKLGERGNVHPELVEFESEPQLQPQSEERQLQPDPEEQQEMQLHSEVESQLEPEPEQRQGMQPELENLQGMQPELELGLTPSEFEYSASDGEDEDLEFDEDFEEENTRSSRTTIRRKRAPPIKDEHVEALFRSGFPRPDNPYFVMERRCKQKALHVPKEVVNDFNLRFLEEIMIHDEKGRKWTAKVSKWKDGRIRVSKGWRSFCKWNHVQKDDWCIIEIVKSETPEAEIFLKTRLVPAAALRAATTS